MRKVVSIRRTLGISKATVPQHTFGGRSVSGIQAPIELLKTPESVVSSKKSYFSQSPQKAKIRLEISGTSHTLDIASDANIYPISPVMRGDIGHLIAVGFLNPRAHFLFIHNPEDPASLEQILSFRNEIQFYLKDKFQAQLCAHPHPHLLYQELTENTEESSSFYRAGHATTLIGRVPPEELSRHFQERLDPLIQKYKGPLDLFLYTQLGINPDRSVKKIFLWGRNSKIHRESNTTSQFLKSIAATIKDSAQEDFKYQIIYTGDKHQSKSDKFAIPSKSTRMQDQSELFIREFWKTNEFKALCRNIAENLPMTIVQQLVIRALDIDGHNSCHISPRSGNIDKLSFFLNPKTNHCVAIIPETGTERVEKLRSISPVRAKAQSPEAKIDRVLRKQLNELKKIFNLKLKIGPGPLTTSKFEDICNDLKKNHKIKGLKTSITTFLDQNLPKLMAYHAEAHSVTTSLDSLGGITSPQKVTTPVITQPESPDSTDTTHESIEDEISPADTSFETEKTLKDILGQAMQDFLAKCPANDKTWTTPKKGKKNKKSEK